jgi:hypothetical protein
MTLEKEIFEKFEKVNLKPMTIQNQFTGDVTTGYGIEEREWNQLKSQILQKEQELQNKLSFLENEITVWGVQSKKALEEKDEQLDLASVEIIKLSEENQQLKKDILKKKWLKE